MKCSCVMLPTAQSLSYKIIHCTYSTSLILILTCALITAICTYFSEFLYTGYTVVYALNDYVAGRSWRGYSRRRRGSVTCAHVSTPSWGCSARGTTGWTCWRICSAMIMKWNMYVYCLYIAWGGCAIGIAWCNAWLCQRKGILSCAHSKPRLQ